MPASARWTALMVAALAARVLLVHFGWHAPSRRASALLPGGQPRAAREAAALVEMGLSPYESMLHVPPLVLLLFTPFLYVADALGASGRRASIVRSAPFVALGRRRRRLSPSPRRGAARKRTGARKTAW